MWSLEEASGSNIPSGHPHLDSIWTIIWLISGLKRKCFSILRNSLRFLGREFPRALLTRIVTQSVRRPLKGLPNYTGDVQVRGMRLTEVFGDSFYGQRQRITLLKSPFWSWLAFWSSFTRTTPEAEAMPLTTSWAWEPRIQRRSSRAFKVQFPESVFCLLQL